MNIRVQNQNNGIDILGDSVGAGHTQRAKQERTAHTQTREKRGAAEAANISFSAGEIGFPDFGNAQTQKKEFDKGKTLTELQQEASCMDVGVSQDYMTLMSHTMSEKDYQELSEEGFHFASLDPEEAVTIVDKIKAVLVQSGEQIVGYTDDLDLDVLAAAVGSETLARDLAQSFGEADIPLTEENIAAVKKAWDMASDLSAPTESTYQYMVDNELEPEIWNFYLAKNSGADKLSSAYGATAQNMDFLSDGNIQRQIDQVLEQAGYALNEENRQDARWLLEHRLALTEDNLQLLGDLKEAVIPVTEDVFAKAAAQAVVMGRDPICANLSKNSALQEDLYKKAGEIAAYYQSKQADERFVPAKDAADETGKGFDDREQLAARKQLEEIRLRMTAEVNVRLLKSGFSLDTAPMEQLLEALRRAEQEVADSYFPKDADAVSKYENWNQTNQVVQEIPALPAQLIGTVRLDAGEGGTVLERFHREGKGLAQTYERAGESYEALMTAPRADLGDSMRKAFSNVDELVRQTGLEPDEQNCRAVRILGYNHMEITQENIQRVMEADAKVQELIRKMTPAATLKMIRDGVNPLEKSFAQLNEYFDGQPESYQKQAESYSRYLYGLEQNNQITQEEREAYIGVYRLLRQIEKKDGAAIGAVVNTQAQLQFSNLLSAVRSGKFKSMDVRATEEFGVLKELVKKGETASISEQISAGYRKMQLEELRQITQMDAAPAAMLERGELPANAENLLAAQGMIQEEDNPFQTLREKAQKLRTAQETAQEMSSADLWERLEEPETFASEYDSMLADLEAQTEELTWDHAKECLDVRELQMTHRQLSIMGALSAKEEYFLPMYVGEELASVHLTLERTGTGKGGISIALKLPEGEQMEAHLQVREGKVEGFLLGNTPQEVTKLKAASDIFSNLIKEDASMDLEAAQLPVVGRENINMTGTSENNSQEEMNSPDNGMLYRVAKLFLQAIR